MSGSRTVDPASSARASTASIGAVNLQRIAVVLSRRGRGQILGGVGFAQLHPALTEVQFGVRNDAVELGNRHHACPKHIPVEIDGPGRAGNGQERGQTGETVWTSVCGVLPVGGAALSISGVFVMRTTLGG